MTARACYLRNAYRKSVEKVQGEICAFFMYAVLYRKNTRVCRKIRPGEILRELSFIFCVKCMKSGPGRKRNARLPEWTCSIVCFHRHVHISTKVIHIETRLLQLGNGHFCHIHTS